MSLVVAYKFQCFTKLGYNFTPNLHVSCDAPYVKNRQHLKLFDPMHFLEIEACVKDKNAACYLFTLDKDLTLFAENLIHANYNNLRVKIYKFKFS